MKAATLLSILLLLTLSCSRNQAPDSPKDEPKPQPSAASATAPAAAPVANPSEQKAAPPSPAPAPTADTAAAAAPSAAAPAADTPPVAAPTAAPAQPSAPVAPALAATPAPSAPNPNPPAKSLLDTVSGVLQRATNRATASSSGAPSAVSSVALANLSSDQISRGLKEALGRGLDHAIAQLGQDGGFLTNMNVRIPMPENLQTVEKLLRKAGQDKLADDFVATMNHAAEKAVPAAAPVFADSLKQMSIDDARGILNGPPDAATQFFRRTAGPQLQEKFRPIVAQATAQAGATAAYKNLLDRASFAGPFLKKESVDLDEYVTGKATDGLFQVVAEEEKKIRQNPVARTTDLLKSVFGALGK